MEAVFIPDKAMGKSDHENILPVRGCGGLFRDHGNDIACAAV
jgi:hypothetical protein